MQKKVRKINADWEMARQLFNPKTLIVKGFYNIVEQNGCNICCINKQKICGNANEKHAFDIMMCNEYGGCGIMSTLDIQNTTIYFTYRDDKLLGGIYDQAMQSILTQVDIATEYIYDINETWLKRLKRELLRID